MNLLSFLKQIKLTVIFCSIYILMLQMVFAANESGTNSLANTILTANENQMKALRKEVDDGEAAYLKAVMMIPENSDQIDKSWTAYSQTCQTNLPKIFNLARLEPKSESAFEMFGWIVTNRFNQNPWELEAGGRQSMEFLRDYYAANPSIARICRIVGARWQSNCQPAIDFLKMAADTNTNREVRAQATFALARLLQNKADTLEYWEGNPPAGNARFEKIRATWLAEEKNGNSKSVSQEAEKSFRIVLAEYSDCSSLQPTNSPQYKATLGEDAEAHLFKLERLAVGKVAPEIDGEDIDGKKLKLSDYRGKIVMLSFWASWCGPCMQMVPSEVRLVERMKGKPFVLLGVNGDETKADAKHAIEKSNMTWSSFWSNKGSGGLIPTTWNVSGWPTVYVLDADGIIQLKFEGENENMLNQKIDSLLNQLSNKTKN